MESRSRLGDSPTEAHVNDECRYGCTAGLMYDRESGPRHLGELLRGRLLGPQAAPVVRGIFDRSFTYDLDIGSVTLPWGESAVVALAVPSGMAELQTGEDNHDHEDGTATTTNMPAGLVKDVVCGMMIDPARAAATSEYRGKTYYFCAPICKARFEAAPERYVKI